MAAGLMALVYDPGAAGQPTESSVGICQEITLGLADCSRFAWPSPGEAFFGAIVLCVILGAIGAAMGSRAKPVTF